MTDLTVDWVDLYNEAGNGLVSTNRSMVEANGLRTWTLTTSLGTAGERTLSIGTTLADEFCALIIQCLSPVLLQQGFAARIFP